MNININTFNAINSVCIPNTNIITPKNKLESILKYKPLTIRHNPYTNIVNAKHIPKNENGMSVKIKSKIKQTIATATVVI